MLLKKSFIIFVSILNTSAFAQKCSEGLSILWEFNQKKDAIYLKEVFPVKVCTHIKKQMSANFKFILKKNNKVVFENEVFWRQEKIYESADKDGNMTGFDEKGIDYKILKFPTTTASVDSYEVVEIGSGKKFGQGAVKLKE